MPILKNSELIPPFWLPNGHLQSIYPALFRKIEDVNYQRERIITEDHDFLDLDWSFAKQKSEEIKTLVILSHGLEGNSTRQYVLGMVRLLNTKGFDCLAWNYRSCSGVMNSTSRFYHSGATDDLESVIKHAVTKGYQKIDLIGFSLGGNLTLKYLGEPRVNDRINKAVVFSVPMDLRASSLSIIKSENQVYMHRFLRTLKLKVDEKSRIFPKEINIANYRHVKTLYDFDHIFTAPLHGFEGADHYYEKCSSMFFVENITVPTLIVHAENDPIVPFSSLPFDLIASKSNIGIVTSKHGGHCGFRPSKIINGAYWSENIALDYLSNSIVS